MKKRQVVHARAQLRHDRGPFVVEEQPVDPLVVCLFIGCLPARATLGEKAGNDALGHDPQESFPNYGRRRASDDALGRISGLLARVGAGAADAPPSPCSRCLSCTLAAVSIALCGRPLWLSTQMYASQDHVERIMQAFCHSGHPRTQGLLRPFSRSCRSAHHSGPPYCNGPVIAVPTHKVSLAGRQVNGLERRSGHCGID